MENQNVSPEEVYDDGPSLSLGLSIRYPKNKNSRKASQLVIPNWNAEKSSLISTLPQDADYTTVLPSNDELENLIIARSPRSEYWKFCHVNKRWLSLIKSGEVHKIRRAIGFTEPSLYVLEGGNESWWEFYRPLNAWRKLPMLPADCMSFIFWVKETVCAGTHLLVSGKDFDGLSIWIYDMVMDEWYKGPNMLTVRCLFASATRGNFAYVAGGIGSDNSILNSAEKYNSETKSWKLLPSMKRSRKFASGLSMDGKFYVIGGRDENDNGLTCGEAFDETKGTWELIPNMLRGIHTPKPSSHFPLLVVAVNNELYLIDTSSNKLKVYLKNTVSWKSLGPVPVRADLNQGWGVKLNSSGNELLIIDATSKLHFMDEMSIFTCCPDPDATEMLDWKPLKSRRGHRGSRFIMNCAVMLT